MLKFKDGFVFYIKFSAFKRERTAWVKILGETPGKKVPIVFSIQFDNDTPRKKAERYLIGIYDGRLEFLNPKNLSTVFINAVLEALKSKALFVGFEKYLSYSSPLFKTELSDWGYED